MVENEKYMKSRGENRVWKSVLSKSASGKKASSTQIGQKLLLEETLRIFEDVKDWVDNKSARSIRMELKSFFNNDEILKKCILETMLLLSSNIEKSKNKEDYKFAYRHKKINTVRKRIMLNELSFNNTWRFVEVVIDYSSFFKVEKIVKKKGGKYISGVSYTCTLSKVILDKLSIEAAEAFYPLPMTEKPLDWSYNPFTKKIIGGYKDFQFDMIRYSDEKADYSLYSKDIFKACNLIQEVPWVINENILNTLIKDIKMPLKSNYIKMEYPDIDLGKWDIDLDDAKDLSESEISKIRKNREELKEKIGLYNAEKSDYDSAVGKYQSIKLAIEIAKRYINSKAIYFPHSYDFRGRIYPLSVGISPQGSDEVKALLLYKNVEPLTETGIKWNWAYLASLYGDDKLPFNERVERGQDLIDADYLEADEPYQFLSHQIELNKWICNQSYIPNTRVHLDACNSGSQFTSAITGDKTGCESTNVFPTYGEDGKIDRKDAYLLVAQKAISITKDLIKKESNEEQLDILSFLLQLLKDNGRKICKRPTMVSNYGGTSAGRANMLWDMFRELGCPHKYITKKNASIFSKIIGDSIKGVLNGGKAFESYVQKMTMLIAKDNNPIEWRTSDGFHIIHKKNKELAPTKVSCMLPGARRSTIIKKNNYSKDLSPYKMRSAISPNYIHSLDAELLRRTALRMKDFGIDSVDYIHDSFGCHPNHVEKLLKTTKEEFIRIMKGDPLFELDYSLRSQVKKDSETIKRLKKVELPNLNGFDTKGEYFNKCLDSDWFFS